MDQRISHIPISDIEESNQQHESLGNALTSIGDVLGHASEMLDDLEKDGMLGPAIRRYAADLATVVGNVARDLDCAAGSEMEKKRWARAVMDDAQSQLALEEGGGGKEEGRHGNANDSNNVEHQSCHGDALIQINNKSAAGAISKLDEGDIIHAMMAARLILLDVEEALLDISVDDAEEIADVGLVVAKMFLWGLQNVQSQVMDSVIDQDAGFSSSSSTMRGNTLGIEIIDDDDDYDSNLGQKNTTSKSTTNKQQNSTSRKERMRVLWPPIGPAVISAASWGKNEAAKHPILSIAMAMALWPTTLIVAFLGAPLIAADYVLQSGYDALEDQPLIKNIEKGAANVCQVGKLYFLISKLMVKQSIRVGKRQIRRRGGVGKVVGDVGNWAVDRITHPVESAGMAWNTLMTGTGIVVNAASFVKDAAVGNIELNGGHMTV